MNAILKFDFQKKKTITFFRRKLSKLDKKETILNVSITFSLKQGETRASSGPISLCILEISCQSLSPYFLIYTIHFSLYVQVT